LPRRPGRGVPLRVLECHVPPLPGNHHNSVEKVDSSSRNTLERDAGGGKGYTRGRSEGLRRHKEHSHDGCALRRRRRERRRRRRKVSLAIKSVEKVDGTARNMFEPRG